MPASQGSTQIDAFQSTTGLLSGLRKAIEMPKSTTPMMRAPNSLSTVVQPDQYTIKSADTKPSGESTAANGRRYGRTRSGSDLRSAPRDTGANAYMIAVADVTRPTRLCQLGKGRKTISPTTNASRIETQGTPRLLTLSTTPGM